MPSTENNAPAIDIRPFRVENQAQVKSLVLAGLVEHWGIPDPTKNPDLDDIAASYAHATFLVAWQDGKIVGTGALVPRTDGTVEIVRVSVDKTLRRQGIGRLILQELCRRARVAGYRRIVLETTDTWDGVIEFYKRFGFHVIHQNQGEIYFALDLVESV